MLRFEDLIDLVRESRYLIIINKITGLNALGSEPSKPDVLVLYPGLGGSSDSESKDFVSLFVSMPPYEPISYPRIRVGNIEFQGVYVWFLEPERGELLSEGQRYKVNDFVRSRGDVIRFLEDEGYLTNSDSIPDSHIILGVAEKGYAVDTEKLKRVALINLLSIDEDSLRIRLRARSGGVAYITVWIEYGARYLSRVVKSLCGSRGISDAGSCMDTVDRQLRSHVAATGTRLYYIGSLNYMTYCFGGKYITTDPLANKLQDINKYLQSEGVKPLNPVCPPCEWFRRSPYRRSPYLCRNDDGRLRFHYSRRVFPKIHPRFKHSIAATWSPSEVTAPFAARLVRDASYVIKVEELSMILPSVDALVIRPKKKPYAELRMTNGLVVLINEDFVSALLSIIYSAKDGSRPYFSVESGCLGGWWSLYDVLYAKYLLSMLDGAFGISYKEDDDGPRIIGRSGVDWLRVWGRRLRDPQDPDFVRFVGRTLSHTIAHALIQKISEVLGIDMSNLLYIYDDIDKGPSGRYYIAGVFEYSKTGVLQLDAEIAEYVRKRYGGDDKDTALKLFVIDAILDALNAYDTLPYIVRGGREEERKRRCGAIMSQVDELVNSYLGLGRQVVNTVYKIVEDFIRNFALYLDSYEIRFDFTTFKYVIEKAIHEKDGLYDRVMGEVREKIKDEGSRNKLRQFINELIDLLIEYYAPPICMDGCSYDIYLENQCTESILENVTTSRELLRAFAVVSGFLGAGTLRVSSNSLYRLVKAARRELGILTAFTSTHMIDLLRWLLTDKARERLEINFELSRDRKDERSLIREIGNIRSSFPDRFRFSLTDMPSHEKRYIIDDIDLATSWNFTSPSDLKYETVSFHYRLLRS